MSSVRHVRKRIARAILVALSGLSVPAAALAQVSALPSPDNWTIEFMAGGAIGIASSGGTSSELPAGTPFTTAGSRPSRAVSSWYFGDGAALLNDVLAQFSSANGTSFATIMPIDAVVQQSAARRGRGVLFGARLTRTVSSRMLLELSVDRRPSSIAFTGSARDGLEASRASFQRAFQGLLATAPAANLSVTSTLDVASASGGQTQLTGALVFDVARIGRARVYVVGGGGVARDTSAVTATLTGTYRFLLLSTYTIAETDKTDVTVSGTPTTPAQAPTTALPTLTTPSVQFSTQAGSPSSLSATTKDIETFRSGLDSHVTFTAGIFVRF
jgi:hypothetical protein